MIVRTRTALFVLILAMVVLAPLFARAQGTITTVAGQSWVYPSGGPAANPLFARTGGVAVDSFGNVYVSDPLNNVVVRITAGIQTIYAGTGEAGSSGDGDLATSATLRSPRELALDAAGNLFIVDYGNDRVRKVTPGGIVSTLTSISGDAAVLGAHITASPAGDVFVSFCNRTVQSIVKVAPDGTRTSVLTGSTCQVSGSFGGEGGPAGSAQVNGISGIAADQFGNLFFADTGNNRVRKIAPDGTVWTVAGSGVSGFSGDGGPAAGAALNGPISVAVDSIGNLFITDAQNYRIRKVALDGTITTLAGTGIRGFSGDGGPAASASVITGPPFDAAVTPPVSPGPLAVDAAGNVFFSDSARVRKIATDGAISTFAANGTVKFAGNGVSGTKAWLNSPQALAIDPTGIVFVADTLNNRVRKITTDGFISTVAGNGDSRYTGEGMSALSAGLSPWGVAVDAIGNVFIADAANNRVRKVGADGLIWTVAGSGKAQFSGDGGPALSAGLTAGAVALDAAGSLFIADYANHRVRKVTPDGIISTVAGNGDERYAGDGGTALSAGLSPAGLAVDAAGNLFIADPSNNRVRKVSAAGIISTIAGGGSSSNPLTATSAALSYPYGLTLDTAGNLYIAEAYGHSVRKVTPDGKIFPAAGGAGFGFFGDNGPATAAYLFCPTGVALDQGGNLFIADQLNDRIRRVSAPPKPAINPGGLVNASNYGTQLAPGSIVSLFGRNLAYSIQIAGAVPLPTMLGSASVLVNGNSAPLFYSSPTQLNFQLPWELAGSTQISVVVSVAGVAGGAQTISLSVAAPGIFSMDSSGTGQGAVQIANTTTIVAPAGSVPMWPSRPAKRGEYLTIYCAGLGDVTNRPKPGAVAVGSPLSVTVTTPTVTIGGQKTTVIFSGLTPGNVGLYQVNVQVPANAPIGDAIPLVVNQSGVASNTVTIAVQ